MIIILDMHERPVLQDFTVHSVRHHAQKRVGAPLNPRSQGGRSFAKHLLEAGEHAGGTAPPWEPQQTPEKLSLHYPPHFL